MWFVLGLMVLGVTGGMAWLKLGGGQAWRERMLAQRGSLLQRLDRLLGAGHDEELDITPAAFRERRREPVAIRFDAPEDEQPAEPTATLPATPGPAPVSPAASPHTEAPAAAARREEGAGQRLPAGRKPAQHMAPAADLPHVELVRSYRPSKPQAKPQQAVAGHLPVIGLDEMQDNLHQGSRRRQAQRHVPAGSAESRPLPVIDPHEVRAQVNALHHKRRNNDTPVAKPAVVLQPVHPAPRKIITQPIPPRRDPPPPEPAIVRHEQQPKNSAYEGWIRPPAPKAPVSKPLATPAIDLPAPGLSLADIPDAPLPSTTARAGVAPLSEGLEPAVALPELPEVVADDPSPAVPTEPAVPMPLTIAAEVPASLNDMAEEVAEPAAVTNTMLEVEAAAAMPVVPAAAAPFAAVSMSAPSAPVVAASPIPPEPEKQPWRWPEQRQQVDVLSHGSAAAPFHALESDGGKPLLPWTIISERSAPGADKPADKPDSPLVWHLLDETEVDEPPRQEMAEQVPVEASPVSSAVPPGIGAADAALPWALPTPAAHRSSLPVIYGEECLPGLDLLRPAEEAAAVVSEDELLERGILIEEKLAEFKVKVSVVDAYAGPVITRYEVEPAVGVRGNQVVNLMKDLSRALGLASIRVVETIPGKTCMGLELPNAKRQMIRLSEIFSADVFQQPASRLTMALGKDITGQPVAIDLAKAPHLLVAGTTGSGKSVGVNAMILSMLYKATPDEVRFIMIDPKMLELSVYNDIPHLLAPVVTDMKLAANALNWCVGEMERRYRLMSALGVRNLAGYNDKVREAEQAGRRLSNPFSLTPETPEPLNNLPFIVVVVDEFADLMMVAGKKIEELIARLAQKARAAGIHLILATQRPSVDVITGLIKANIPTRIAFQVSSKIDSRTILDQMGAESLLGQGDMLFLPPGSGYPQRVHGAFVTDDEVHAVVDFLKQWGEPDYVEGLLTGESEADDESAAATAKAQAATETDPLYDEAVEIVLKTRKPSISAVQRHLRIGYNRAARLIEQMELAGIVSPMESNGNRTVLVPQREF